MCFLGYVLGIRAKFLTIPNLRGIHEKIKNPQNFLGYNWIAVPFHHHVFFINIFCVKMHQIRRFLFIIFLYSNWICIFPKIVRKLRIRPNTLRYRITNCVFWPSSRQSDLQNIFLMRNFGNLGNLNAWNERQISQKQFTEATTEDVL